MKRQNELPKPDVGGTMTTGGKIAFIIFLCIVLTASVVFSFNTLSRKTYEFEYTEDYDGTGKAGWIFNGFNGESGMTEIHIEHPMEKVDGEWTETDGDVIAVSGYTFNSDEYVEYIYIGPTVEYIEDQAFVYCKALRAFYVDADNPSYCSVDGVLYNKDMTEIISYPVCHCTQTVLDDVANYGEVKNIGRENVESFTIEGAYDENAAENGTLYVNFRNYIKTNYSGDFENFSTFDSFSELYNKGVYAPYLGTYYIKTGETDEGVSFERFWTCDEKYEIPEGVTEIDSKAFYKCDRLVSVTLPSTVKTIGDMAFFKCSGTSLITLPDGLESIGSDAFSYCTNMNYAMFIPASVKTIGHHCFYKCNEDMLFYMGAESSDDIELGGRWQPRSDNSFKADEPIWGASREDCDSYNNGRYAEDAKAAEEAAANAVTEDTSSDTASNGMNKNAMIALIICFIPCFIYIGLQVVRNVFKEDFLMTAKGKEKLRKRKEENEKIHQAYVNGDFEESPESEDKPDEKEEKEEEVTDNE